MPLPCQKAAQSCIGSEQGRLPKDDNVLQNLGEKFRPYIYVFKSGSIRHHLAYYMAKPSGRPQPASGRPKPASGRPQSIFEGPNPGHGAGGGGAYIHMDRQKFSPAFYRTSFPPVLLPKKLQFATKQKFVALFLLEQRQLT